MYIFQERLIVGLTIVTTGNINILPVNPIDDGSPVSEKEPVDWIRCYDAGKPEIMLGLIAGEKVEIKTEWYDGDPIPVQPDGIKIKAAVFAFGTGFYNEGVVTFEGSITQNQNALLTGTDDPGFTDNYSYNDHIPPHYIEPQNARYEITNGSWKETNEHLSYE